MPPNLPCHVQKVFWPGAFWAIMLAIRDFATAFVLLKDADDLLLTEPILPLSMQRINALFWHTFREHVSMHNLCAHSPPRIPYSLPITISSICAPSPQRTTSVALMPLKLPV